MSNANVFVMYADGNGNVTLSPRHARGEVMPQYDSAIDAQLLSGSGVSNGVMTANVRCRNCQSWQNNGRMDFTASSAGFIHARSKGQAIDSTDPQSPINIHDTHGEFNWPFATAKGGASVNPFQDSTLTSTTPGPAGGPAAGGGPKGKSGIDRRMVRLIHGIFASLAFVAFFPLGGILIRVGRFPGLIWVHAGIQIFAWILFITAFGLGLYYGITGNYMTEAHPIIGIVLVGLLFFQPLLGWIHHRTFLRTGARSGSSYGHIWVGRIAIPLGIVNGGLGLKLSRVENKYVIVYSVFAGLMGVAYLAAIAIGEMARRKARNVPVDNEKLTKKPSTSPERSHSGPHELPTPH